MRKSKGGIFLALFGSVFLAVGVGMGFYLIKSLEEAKSMLTWDEKDAVIKSCDLRISRGSKGGSTYKVVAEYTYLVGSKEFTGERVSLSAGYDNIGSFHRDLYQRLKKSAESGKPVKCYVNPRNKGESILVRKPRAPMMAFQLLFVFAFGGVGLAIALSGLLVALTPDTTADDLMQPRIRMRGISTHKVALAVAGFWNLVGVWVLVRSVQLLEIVAVPPYLWAMCLSGVIPAVIALYLLLRMNKYGVSYFEMSPMPGVLGGPVSGNIRIPREVKAQNGFRVELQCIHQYTTRSGKNSTTHRDVLWDATEQIETVYSYGTEVVIPVNFRVPYNQPGTSASGNRNGHYWQMKVRAKAPGIDYYAVFDVPVRHTAQSRSDYAEETGPPAGSSSDTQTFEQVIRAVGLGCRHADEDTMVIEFPACSSVSSAVFLAFFAAIWTGACIFMRGRAPAFFVGVFIFFDILLVWGLLNMIFVSMKLTVNTKKRALFVDKFFAGLPYRSVKIGFNEMDVVEYERGMQSGSKIFYRVVVNLIGGKRISAGGSISSRTGAKRIADELNYIVKEADKKAKSSDSLDNMF